MIFHSIFRFVNFFKFPRFLDSIFLDTFLTSPYLPNVDSTSSSNRTLHNDKRMNPTSVFNLKSFFQKLISGNKELRANTKLA